MKPTLKPYTFAIHTCNRAIQKLQKSMPLPTLKENKKHKSTTKPIRNAGLSGKLKVNEY